MVPVARAVDGLACEVLRRPPHLLRGVGGAAMVSGGDVVALAHLSDQRCTDVEDCASSGASVCDEAFGGSGEVAVAFGDVSDRDAVVGVGEIPVWPQAARTDRTSFFATAVAPQLHRAGRAR